MSALKQPIATMLLGAVFGSGSYTARTGAMMAELDSVTGTQSTAGTPVTGGSYADQAITFGTPTTQTGTFSGTIANTNTVTFTGMPAVTITGITLKDSAGTPTKYAAGPLAASQSVTAGNTVVLAIGSVSISC